MNPEFAQYLILAFNILKENSIECSECFGFFIGRLLQARKK